MIQDSDLRIGNCVYAGSNFENSDLSKPTVLIPCRIPIGFTSTENYYPVRLTDEILTKIGYPLHDIVLQNGSWKEYRFGKDFKGIFCPDGKLEFGYNMFHYGSSLNQKLEFVHDLQNIYYVLTKTELDIEW